MSKIVITGGAGFIGSHLGQGFAKAGHEVVLADNLDDYYSPELKRRSIDCVLRNGNATFVKADVTDIDALERIITKGVVRCFEESCPECPGEISES